MDERDEWIFIAGVYLDPLLDNLDELEQRLCGLPQYTELAETITDTLDLMNDSTAFWLDSTGDFQEGAATICMGVWQRLDSIQQEAEFRDASALADTVRWAAAVETEASDSALVAIYAMVLALEGLRALYDWQIELRQALVGVAQPSLYNKQQLSRAHACMVDYEVAARVHHAECVGQARQALFQAGVYRQIENIAPSADGYRLADLLRSAIQAPVIARARSGGIKGAQAKKVAAADAAEKTCNLARSIKQSEPHLSDAELVERLAEDLILSDPTVRAHLRTQGLYPPKVSRPARKD